MPEVPVLTEAVVTPVINPLPFTVMTGTAVELPKVPVLLFTVANVLTVLPAGLVTSPVKAGRKLAARGLVRENCDPVSVSPEPAV